jgi:hypothetical protein
MDTNAKQKTHKKKSSLHATGSYYFLKKIHLTRPLLKIFLQTLSILMPQTNTI